MEGSDMDQRSAALEDVNALLYNSYANSSTLATCDGWQSWLYALLVDVPKQKDKLHKSVYALTLNVFSNVHTEYFFKSKVPIRLLHPPNNTYICNDCIYDLDW
jgi:NADH:ubiquinone oxidoreductase subunit